MLTKKDINTIKGVVREENVNLRKVIKKDVIDANVNLRKVVKKDIAGALVEFFEKILIPYFDEHVEKRFEKIEDRVGAMEKRRNLS